MLSKLWAALVVLLLLLTGCGGGGSATATPEFDTAVGTGVSAESIAINSRAVSMSADMQVQSLNLKSATRIGRTVWQYVYTVAVINMGVDVADVTLRLTAVGDGTSIVVASFTTGPVKAGETVSGTVTVQHDRLTPFSADGWKWAANAFVETLVTIDPSLSQSVAARIIKVTSIYDEKTLGKALLMEADTPEESAAVLAVDSEDQILLGGFAKGGNATLDSRSTALILARILFGMPPEVAPSELNRALQATTGFDTLVDAVNTAVLAGNRPMNSETVMQALLAVVSNAQPLTKTAALGGIGSKSQRLSISSPQVDLLPYSILNAGLTVQRPIKAVSNNSSGGLNIVNSTLIAYAAIAKDTNGGIIRPIPENADGATLLPSASLLSFIIGPDPTLTAGNGASYNLLISSKNERSRIQNYVDISTDSLSLILSFAPTQIFSKSCVLAGINAGISGDEFNKFAREPSTEGFLSVLFNISFSRVNSMFTALAVCSASPRERSSSFTIAVLKAISGFAKFALPLPIDTLAHIYDGVGLASKIAVFQKEYDNEVTVGVCLQSAVVVNCAVSLKVSPRDVQLQVGSTVRLGVSMLDRFGQPTITARKLTWSSDSTFASVDESGMVNGVSVGNTTIYVLDEYTGLTDSVRISVGPSQCTITTSIYNSPITRCYFPSGRIKSLEQQTGAKRFETRIYIDAGGPQGGMEEKVMSIEPGYSFRKDYIVYDLLNRVLRSGYGNVSLPGYPGYYSQSEDNHYDINRSPFRVPTLEVRTFCGDGQPDTRSVINTDPVTGIRTGGTVNIDRGACPTYDDANALNDIDPLSNSLYRAWLALHPGP